MKEKIILVVLAAIVGGVVGAGAVLYFPQKSQVVTSLDELNVKKLKISDTLFLWPEGKDDADLIMTQGGILARTRIIATQICGNLLVGNAVFTTPDNPQLQVDQCRIFTEMGSNPNTGGAFVVRSPNGAHVLSQGVSPNGFSYNVGFDERDGLWGYSLDNSTKERALMVLQRVNIGPPQSVSETETSDANTPVAPETAAASTVLGTPQNAPPMVAQPGVATSSTH